MTTIPPAFPEAGVHTTPPTTFASVLRNKSPPLSKSLPSNPELTPRSEHLGDAACLYSDEQIATLSAHYANALVGKFTKGRCPMEQLEQVFKTVGFIGKYQLGSLDYKHVLIRFEQLNDYQRCWMKGVWNFNGIVLKMLKWTPEFSTHKESPIVPIWLTIKEVPLYYYNSASIESIGNSLGSFIKTDLATEMLTRPSAIKICIEVDLQKPLVTNIRLGSITNNRKYSIEYEDIPLYCTHCSKLGHSITHCRALIPRTNARSMDNKTQQVKTVWQPTGSTHQKDQAPPTCLPPDAEKITDISDSPIHPHPHPVILNDSPGVVNNSVPETFHPDITLEQITKMPAVTVLTPSSPVNHPDNTSDEISSLLDGNSSFIPMAYATDDIQVGVTKPQKRDINNVQISFLGELENRFSVLQEELEDQDLETRDLDDARSEPRVNSTSPISETNNTGEGKSKGKKTSLLNELNKMMLRSSTKSHKSSEQ